MVFGEDFDENILAFIIEEGLVGKLASSKLAPILCDFVLISIGRTNSAGSNAPDLLNLPQIINPRVLLAYERLHETWSKRRFDAYLHFASTCAQFLEVKHLAWLAHLVLGYRRIPPATSSLEHAIALLTPFCEEVLAHCDQLGLQLGNESTSDVDDAGLINETVARCRKFVDSARVLAKNFYG